MAWCRPGDKPLSEPMMVTLPTHICVTRLNELTAVGHKKQALQNFVHIHGIWDIFKDDSFKMIAYNVKMTSKWMISKWIPPIEITFEPLLADLFFFFLFGVVDILGWYFYFYTLWLYLMWFCFSSWVFYVHNDLALYIFALPRSRILAYWLMLSVVKTTINKVYLILSYLNRMTEVPVFHCSMTFVMKYNKELKYDVKYCRVPL